MAAQLLANVIGTAAGICGMIGFTPQIAKIVREKDASSVSLKMYAITTTGFVLWTTYGLLLKSWPIAGSNAVMLCLAAAILVLKLKYR
jgi:MtN3 and saliva related transmembrane protein